MSNATIEIEKYLEIYRQYGHLDNIIENKTTDSECSVIKHHYGHIFNDFHHHDPYEILYIISGKVIYGIENKKYILEPGDMVIISPTVLHKLIEIIEGPCERIVLTFTSKYISKFNTPKTNVLEIFDKLNNENNHKVSFNNVYKKRFETILTAMSEIYTSDEYGDDLVFNACFAMLMVLLNREYSETTISEPIISSESELLNKIRNYILENIDKKITISDIAKIVSLSESRISHIFKKETGISILKYINKKRLIKSKELLKSGESITNIYYKCGFNDYTSFFRSFKKEYGITPKEFQNNYKFNKKTFKRKT